jgi:hypothetical protein
MAALGERRNSSCCRIHSQAAECDAFDAAWDRMDQRERDLVSAKIDGWDEAIISVLTPEIDKRLKGEQDQRVIQLCDQAFMVKNVVSLV